MSRANWPSTRFSLLMRIREADDEEAWRTFVDLYAPAVYRFCRRQGLQDSDARDVGQEVFAQVGRSIRQFQLDHQHGKFRNWLGTIIYREILRHREKINRPGRGVGGETGQERLARLEGEIEADWIVEFNSQVQQFALRRIRVEFSADVWLAFERVWLEDRKPRDLAEELNCRVEWLYRIKHRVLQRLREEVEFLTADVAGLEWNRRLQ